MNRGVAGLMICATALLASQQLAAQDASDSAAYRALTQTPVGAFSPWSSTAIAGRRGAGLALHARYGVQSFRSNDYVHNVGAGVDLPLANGRLGVTFGRYNPTCPRDDCPGHYMVSLSLDQNLAAVALGRSEHAASLDIGLQGAVGYARPEGTLLSGSAVVPFALVPRREGLRFFPFVAPGGGVGLTHQADDTDAGMLPLLAMGVSALGAGDRLGVTAGVTRAFLRGGNWVAGVNVGWALHR
jgi:hypothetical protein